MTHHVHFYAERAFLRFVRITLAESSEEISVEVGAVCVLATAAALEASINALFEDDHRLRHFDELRLQSKVETLADWGKVSLEWGKQPWQDIAELIRVRNWLAHFKDSYMGLTSLSEGWVADEVHRKPRMDPFLHLGRDQVTRYYDATKAALDQLVVGLSGGMLGERPQFRSDEDGDIIEVG